MPVSRRIAPQKGPWALRVAILEASTPTLGPPSLAVGHRIRSTGADPNATRPRSSSATPPSTVKTILPVGALVSTCSDKETKSIPRALKVSRARSR
jgi:hypothetical protein